ncbi:PAS domain S-box protein [Tychonema sp. BBK16]|uniref:PAS domain S-box protein n=1 Tax=Tychonema sp. BBK16 TaxID=2699888 RepID=UPI001F41EC1B|nr:PAS domain S-box protein [Tychonema sp. BBK16]
MFANKNHSSNPETNNSHSICTGDELKQGGNLCSREIERDWYRTLYDHFPGIYFVLDALGRVYSLNQFGASRLGYRQQELVGHSIFNIFYSQNQGKLQAEFAEFVQPRDSDYHQKLNVWEGRLICKDGKSIWVKATALTMPANGGEIVENSTQAVEDFQLPSVLLVCEEITSPKIVAAQADAQKNWRSQTQAIAKLAKSQAIEGPNIAAFIREFTEIAVNILNCDRASIWLYSKDRRQLHCLDLYEKNTKLHFVQIIITAADCPAYFTALKSETTIAAVAATNDPRTRELAGIYFSDRGITSLLNHPIMLSGEMVGIVSAERGNSGREWTESEQEFTEILADFVSTSLAKDEKLKSELIQREQQQNLLSLYYGQLEEKVEKRTAELRKINQEMEEKIIKKEQIEVEIRQKQQEQQIILDSIPAMIWYKDTESHLLRINKAAAASKGLPPDQLEGKSFYEIYPDEAEQYYLEDLQVINSGVPKLGKIHALPTLSGQKCWVRTDKIPYHDETGKVAGVIVFSVDITDLIRVEKKLRYSRDRLEEKVEKRTAMYRQAMAALYSANTQLQQLIKNPNSSDEINDNTTDSLLESDAYFEAVAVASRDTILNVSKIFAELFGYKPEEMVGMSLLELLSPKSYKQAPQMISAASNTVCETIFLKRDGTAFPADVRSKFVLYEGRLVQVKAVRDLTERKLIEAELERSRSVLHATLEATADGILAVTTAGELISFNENLVQMWGISEEIKNSMDRNMRLTFLTKQVKDPKAFLYRIKQIYNDAEAEICDILEFKDGRTFERYTQPIRVAQNIIGRVWRFRDITARSKVTAMLGDSQRRFRAIFDSSFQFVSLLKPDGTLLEANQTSLDFAGINLRDVANRPFWEGPWWAGSQEIREQLQEAISRSANGEFVRYEVEVKGANRTATVDFSLKPVADETGKIVLLLPECRDITESKQAQVALRQQVERERLITQIQSRIRSSLDFQDILNTTVAEVREFLATDRVIVFRFRPDWNGDVVVESVGEGWMPLLGKIFDDCCFASTYVGQYLKGRIRAIEDVRASNLDECHVNFLAECQVKANLVVPIVQQGMEPGESNTSCHIPKLWGLLIAHHCSAPRIWQKFDVDLLSQLGTQVAMAIEQSQLYQQLAAANQRLDGLVNLDSLTQLGNRRRFDEVLNREWEQCSSSQPLSLIMCDIDCFKLYNDNYGHQAGDACLQQVARAIGDTCKNASAERLYLAARYGGEEFGVILPNTDIVSARAVAEEICHRVKVLAIPHEKSVVTDCVTLSLGVASISEGQNSPKMLIEAADKALYRAKSGGRDRVVISQ